MNTKERLEAIGEKILEIRKLAEECEEDIHFHVNYGLMEEDNLGLHTDSYCSSKFLLAAVGSIVKSHPEILPLLGMGKRAMTTGKEVNLDEEN